MVINFPEIETKTKCLCHICVCADLVEGMMMQLKDLTAIVCYLAKKQRERDEAP